MNLFEEYNFLKNKIHLNNYFFYLNYSYNMKSMPSLHNLFLIYL